MDGKINKDGYLEIKRGQDWTIQDCASDRDYYCAADVCPQFSEPEQLLLPEFKPYSFFKKQKLAPTGVFILYICNQKTLIFDNFTDERDTEGN